MTELEQLPQFLELWQDTLYWQPTPEQQVKFQRLYEEILLGNRQLNLTRITEVKEFWEKHLWDSLSPIIPLGLSDQELSVIDIGTGAGFPGLPVAIAYPNWRVTLLDSVQKKLLFLKSLLPKLEMKNTTVLIGRVEAIAQDKTYRETFDLALIRAVASASVCAEYGLPLLKRGGSVILYRGHWSEEENVALDSAVRQLGGKIAEIKKLTTPLSESSRHCIYIRKIASTPKQYPRGVGIARQHPL